MPGLVSVIIPTYNRAHCLMRAVRSVLCQSHAQLELIVADDGSTDGTGALVRGLTDPRVRYLRQEPNRGAASARNLGIAAARGAFIAFHDSDDEWLLDKLERQLAALEALGPDHGAVFGPLVTVGRDAAHRYGAGRVSITPGEGYAAAGGDLLPQLLRNNVIGPPTLLLRAPVMRALGGFDARLPNNEDWEFMLRLAQVTRIGFVPDPVAIVHVSPDGAHHRRDASARAFLAITRRHAGLFAANPAALSAKQFAAGRYLHKLGRWRSARLCMGRAIRTHPLAWRPWAGYALAWLRQVASRRRAGG